MSVRCTVLGGSGFVGRALAEKLRLEGHEVWVPDRHDEDVYKQPLGNVFYCIGLTAGFRHRPYDTVTAHVEVLSKILRGAQYDSLLYMSSTRVYSRSSSTSEHLDVPVLTANADDLYNISKLAGESLCLSSSNPTVRVARLSNVVGPMMGTDNLVGSLMQEALAGRIDLRTHPDSQKDYVFIDDVVKLLSVISFEGKERIYNVASGHQTSHREWTSAIARLTNCEVNYNSESPSQSFKQIDIDRLKTEFHFKPTLKNETITLTLRKIQLLQEDKKRHERN